MPNLDFSTINLPDEDGKKPADLGDTTDTTTDKAGTTSTDTTTKTDTTPDLGDKHDNTQAADASTDKTDSTDTTTEKKIDDGTGDKSDLTPFHQHPDWQKMQTEKRALEDTVNQLKGQLDTLTKIAAPTKAEEKVIIKSAEERIQEDLASGWEPKDAVELNLRTVKYVKEELQQQADQKEKDNKAAQDSFNEKRDAIATQIDTIFKDEGITDAKEQETAAALVNTWAQRGMATQNVDTLKTAIEFLKAKGEIGKPAVQAKTAEEIAAETKAKQDVEDKKRTNSKITRGTGGGVNKQTSNVKLDHKPRDLDDLTSMLSTQLDDSRVG